MDFLIVGLATVDAGFFSNPFDVVKTRMQLQRSYQARPRRNMPCTTLFTPCTYNIRKKPKGLAPVLLFQWVVNGVRLGLYQQADNFNLPRDENKLTKFLNGLFFGSFTGAVGPSFGSLFNWSQMAGAGAQGLTRDVTDMLMGGTSAMFATIFTNPIEVVKTRLQLQGELKGRGQHSVHYRGVLHGAWVVARTEGFAALQRGLPAMLGFQFCLNTFRLGVYRISERRGLTTDATGRTSVVQGALAAGVGGALGSIAGTPFYLVKTRLQAQAARAIAVGHQHSHTGLVDALRNIYVKEGVKGLFRGVQPQIPRGAVGSASQMVSFAYAKEKLRDNGYFTNSPLLLSFFGSNLGGVVMTFCLNPFDVVATRLSNQPLDAQNKGKLYSGMIDCFYKMVTKEGAMSLYKGVIANYMRLGPHTVLLLVCWDQLKILEDYLRR